MHKSLTSAEHPDANQIMQLSGWVDNFTMSDFPDGDCTDYDSMELYNTICSLCKEGNFCLYDSRARSTVELTPDNLHYAYLVMQDTVCFND
ncbi:MAG: hypothetical protein NC189_05710 [Bacteroides sp.]|nr:hypothetical protein [Bacteroides sp.]